MADVVTLLLTGLVLAIRGRCRPGELERHERREEQHEQAGHGGGLEVRTGDEVVRCSEAG